MTHGRRRAAIYARVSTLNGQTPENQQMQLRGVTEKAGWSRRSFRPCPMLAIIASTSSLTAAATCSWGATCRRCTAPRSAMPLI